MTTEEKSGDQHRGLEAFAGYKVYDDRGEKIGKVDDLFVDERNRPEYIGVKMGFFGLNSTLIPMEIVRVNDRMRTIEVNEAKNRVKDAPHFDYDDEITSDFEARVFAHFGLRSTSTEERGSYSDYSPPGSEEREEETALRDSEREELQEDRPPPRREREPGTEELRTEEPRVEERRADEPRDHSEVDAGGMDGEREESPGYREGYEAAMKEMGVEPEESSEYREGYEAAMREVERERERSWERSERSSGDRETSEHPPEGRGAVSAGEERREARPEPSGEREGVRIRKRGGAR